MISMHVQKYYWESLISWIYCVVWKQLVVVVVSSHIYHAVSVFIQVFITWSNKYVEFLMKIKDKKWKTKLLYAFVDWHGWKWWLEIFNVPVNLSDHI